MAEATSSAAAAAGADVATPPPEHALLANKVRRGSATQETFLASHQGSMGFGEAFGIRPTDGDKDEVQRRFEEGCIAELKGQLRLENQPSYKRTTTLGFLDLAPFARNAIESIVQDSFTRCFESRPSHPWNWNFYLMPLYVIGVFVRYCILFPLRLVCVLLGFLLFALMMVSTIPMSPTARDRWQKRAIRMLAVCFIMSWTGVIKYHGVCPPRRPNQVFVANHSSLIDVVVLMGERPYSLVGQKHGGVIGFFQDYVLASMNCLWFDRMEANDRVAVARRIKEHISNPANPPLIIFPEGTCVNNEYVVMFKRGAFDLNATVMPIAIKYNKIFVDAFWNSRRQSFPQHLFRLMTSWCVVCDVWYMEPQNKLPDETPIQFANRTKDMIAQQAGLVSVPWDGYLKYFQPNIREKEARQRIFAQAVLMRFPALGEGDAKGKGDMRQRKQAGSRRDD
eukprot:Opistho-1_new@39864